jgi:hypothetical protein
MEFDPEGRKLYSEIAALRAEVARLEGTLATETAERSRVRDLGVAHEAALSKVREAMLELCNAGAAILIGYPITPERNRLLNAIKRARILLPVKAGKYHEET